jgi:predicted aldo/keto reductase-like oxidoreductase
VNIPVILWLRNLLLAYDMAEFAKARYNLLGNGGHWFPGQKAEAIHALDFSDCLRHSPYASKIPAMLADTHQRLGGEAVARLSNA